ncbi:uncharacterized protein LOC110830984 isoform X2 [Zootermopsis nevadensis]|uniref:uncharacterized protein LOC110830984 isoform X2 n=1 Tax=Zootermopsis nevadensis TaxID=136037 RepID=UPI000B8E3017|nr:uncharacterized protein LOC110830984 isoform X2 [Zootermopsis nevadensis]
MSPKNKDKKGKRASGQLKTQNGKKHGAIVVDVSSGKMVSDDVIAERKVLETALERALFRWFERYQQQQQRERHGGGDEVRVTVLLSTAELRKKALSIARRLGASRDLLDLVTRAWIRRWQTRYGVPKASSTPPPLPTQSADVTITVTSAEKSEVQEGAVPSPSEQLRQILRNGEYTADQVYCAYGFQLDWKSLPDRTLEETSPNDKVWVLMAGNRTGRHRTRMLITGRLWRPSCLRHVNMLSQPVVYAGGGSGTVTPDLFTWWFHHEFAPAAATLHPRGAILVIEQAPFVPQESECVAADGAVRLVVYPKGNFGDGAVLDHGLVVSEFRTRYAMMLLSSVTANSTDHQHATLVSDYLRNFVLKDAFPMLHRSWLNLRSETFLRCWDRVASLTNEEPGPCSEILPCTLALSSSGANAAHAQEDRMMLLELQWLSHDLGLEVTDDDLATWAQDSRSEDVSLESVKAEPVDETSEDAVPALPTPVEAADHLARALLWMETEPLDPALLLVVRDIITLAKQASKMGLAATHPGATLPFFCHNGDHLTQPPPAHMGIPPYQLDPKGASAMGEYWRGLGLGLRTSPGAPPTSTGGGSVSATAASPPTPSAGVGLSAGDWKRLGPLLAASGLTRPPMYPFSAGQYPYPMLSPEMSQVAASWHTPSMYPISTAGGGFRSPYPSSLPITSTSLSSDFYRFSPTGLIPPHPGLSPHSHPHSHPHSLASHPAIVTPGPKQELSSHQVDHNHRSSSMDQKNSTSSTTEGSKTQDSGQTSNNQDKKKPHIKKPLNAFMLYMKEMRAKVVAECTLKESAAINQILGRRWHALGREEQAKYYELARRERQLHMQLYPDWSSRANSSRGKKRKRKQETNDGGNSMKKCRARYGLDQQSQWCKPCRRKKKCIRYMESNESMDGNQSEDNLGSCGSVGDANTPPEDDRESINHSLSSPGGLSGLSSLTSPSMILPSPSTSLASPSVSLASPCMSLQSPLTPHDASAFECKTPMNGLGGGILPPHQPPSASSNASGGGGGLPSVHHHHPPHHPPPTGPPLHRNPVGTNPHDINNPLSVNQLTGQCIKTETGGSGKDASSNSARAVISVT